MTSMWKSHLLSLETRGPDFILHSLLTHQHVTSQRQANVSYFQLSLFSSLSDSSVLFKIWDPHFYFVPFKAFFRLYQLLCSRTFKAKEPFLVPLMPIRTLQGCMPYSTSTLSMGIVLLYFPVCFYCACTVGSLQVTDNSRTAATSFSCLQLGHEWHERFAMLHVMSCYGVLLSLQSPKSSQTTQS